MRIRMARRLSHAAVGVALALLLGNAPALAQTSQTPAEISKVAIAEIKKHEQAGDFTAARTVAEATAKVGQEARGRELTGASILDASDRLGAQAQGLVGSVAEPMPQAVAARLGWPTGTKALGRVTPPTS